MGRFGVRWARGCGPSGVTIYKVGADCLRARRERRSRAFTRRLLAVLSALALSSGCRGGPAEPEYPTVTGNWTGTGVSFDTLESWRFRLEESSDGTVTGTFSIRVERLVFSGTVGGTHAYPALSLDLDMVFFGQVVSGTYQGQVISPASIEGQVHLIEDLARTLDLDRLGSQPGTARPGAEIAHAGSFSPL